MSKCSHYKFHYFGGLMWTWMGYTETGKLWIPIGTEGGGNDQYTSFSYHSVFWLDEVGESVGSLHFKMFMFHKHFEGLKVYDWPLSPLLLERFVMQSLLRRVWSPSLHLWTVIFWPLRRSFPLPLWSSLLLALVWFAKVIEPVLAGIPLWLARPLSYPLPVCNE